ncbi:MAG: HEAT repeat domain-containing protein, partial [Anaerolineae bacterium]|nr:HEAT repeat domain-containing protein [Anaerolineae bacterium]
HPAEFASRAKRWGRISQLKSLWYAVPPDSRLEHYLPALLNIEEEDLVRQLLAQYITQESLAQSEDVKARIGGALVQLASDPSANVRAAAAAQMAVLKIDMLWPALLQLRLDQAAGVRTSAVRTIDAFARPETIDLLLDSLRQETDILSLSALIELVAKYNHPAIPDIISEVLDRPGVDDFPDLILPLVHKMLLQKDPTWATEQLLQRLRSGQYHALALVLRILVDASGESVLRELVAFLRQEQPPALRKQAILTLKSSARSTPISDPQLVEAVTQLLLHHLDEVTEKNMQEVEISDVAEVIARNLSHESLEVRGEAVIELARLRRKSARLFRDTPAQDTFWRNVNHSVDGYSQDRMKEACRKWGKMAQLAAVLSGRTNQNAALCRLATKVHAPEMRILILKAIGQNKASDGIPILDRAIYSRSEMIRRAATEALGYYASPNALPALRTALHDTSISVKLAAVNAISGLAVNMQPALDVLIQELDDPDPFHRIDVAYALTRVNTRPAVKALIAHLKSETHPDVLYGIASALGSLEMNYTSIDKALRQLTSHSSQHVTSGARDALKQRRAAAAASHSTVSEGLGETKPG